MHPMENKIKTVQSEFLGQKFWPKKKNLSLHNPEIFRLVGSLPHLGSPRDEVKMAIEQCCLHCTNLDEG